MKAIDRRLRHLENRFGLAPETETVPTAWPRGWRQRIGGWRQWATSRTGRSRDLVYRLTAL